MTSAGGFPDERLGFVVPVGQPLVDGTLQIGDAVIGSSPNHAIRDQSEPALHLIQPGAAGRGEMKVESAALLGPEPTLDGRALVSAVIVHDKVNIQIGWYFLFQFVEEPDELPAAMAGQAAPPSLSRSPC